MIKVAELDALIEEQKGEEAVSDNFRAYAERVQGIRKLLAVAYRWARRGEFKASESLLEDAYFSLSSFRKQIEWQIIPSHYEPLCDLVQDKILQTYKILKQIEENQTESEEVVNSKVKEERETTKEKTRDIEKLVKRKAISPRFGKYLVDLLGAEFLIREAEINLENKNLANARRIYYDARQATENIDLNFATEFAVKPVSLRNLESSYKTLNDTLTESNKTRIKQLKDKLFRA